ncbi:MAG: hypothetical protein FJX77_00975 [Armatimonadetes bacterium]|nr:hypothetical protein [Armatimonadota bacterium]
MRDCPQGVEITAAGASFSLGELWRFLGLDTSLAAVQADLAFDPPVAAAFQAYPGLRLLRQDPWECLSAFVCAQWSSVPKIQNSNLWLARQWGRPVLWPDGRITWTTPRPEALAPLPPEALAPSGLGYRCRYVIGTAAMVAAGTCPVDDLRYRVYEEALSALLSLPGIGRKVADCVLLFSLDQPSACPVDVWVQRALYQHYGALLAEAAGPAPAGTAGSLSAAAHRRLVEFAWDRWGANAGYAQQYLFEAQRRGLFAA